MRLGIVAIILFTSVTTGLAGDFTPIPKNKIAQLGANCVVRCDNLFNLCLQLCGSSCVATSINRLPVSRNCDFERDFCLIGCRSLN